jgi:hypothetical protein
MAEEPTNLTKSQGSKMNLVGSKSNLTNSKAIGSKSSIKGSKMNLSKAYLGSKSNLEGIRSGIPSVHGSKGGLAGDVPNARAIVYENTYRLKPEKKCV